ncbi:MAG: hypothetical protein ISS69_08720 [Phycisphaerae bacterium]|nr:hypothetical protein [Phycisphaerae bacterium]
MRMADARRWSGIALCLVLLGGCQQQEPQGDNGVALSEEVARHAAALRKANRVESALIGDSGSESDVYAIYEKLLAAASEEELVSLLDDKNPAVRVYAFWGLRDKYPDADSFGYLMKRLTDTQQVSHQAGCLKGDEAVADVLLGWVWQYLDESQMEEVKDWLVRNPNNLEARCRVLEDFSPKPKYHAVVRRLAKAGVESSLQALAGYRDPADAPIILGRLNADNADALKAAERFPRPEFFSPLAAMHKVILDMSNGCYHSNKDPYYRAVAASGGAKAAKLLGSVMDIPETDRLRKYPIEAAYTATVCYRKDYPELLMRFFEYCPIPYLESWDCPGVEFPEEGVLEQLLKHDRKRALGAIRAHFVRKKFYGHSQYALKAMGSVLLREMKAEAAFAVINEGLTRANVHQLPALCKFVRKYKFDSSATILLKHLVSTDNGHIQTEAVETLLAYDRQDIRDKIRDLLRQGKVPKNNWGREAVEYRLKEAEKESSKGESGSR